MASLIWLSVAVAAIELAAASDTETWPALQWVLIPELYGLIRDPNGAVSALVPFSSRPPRNCRLQFVQLCRVTDQMEIQGRLGMYDGASHSFRPIAHPCRAVRGQLAASTLILSQETVDIPAGLARPEALTRLIDIEADAWNQHRFLICQLFPDLRQHDHISDTLLQVFPGVFQPATRRSPHRTPSPDPLFRPWTHSDRILPQFGVSVKTRPPHATDPGTASFQSASASIVNVHVELSDLGNAHGVSFAAAASASCCDSCPGFQSVPQPAPIQNSEAGSCELPNAMDFDSSGVQIASNQEYRHGIDAMVAPDNPDSDHSLGLNFPTDGPAFSGCDGVLREQGEMDHTLNPIYAGVKPCLNSAPTAADETDADAADSPGFRHPIRSNSEVDGSVETRSPVQLRADVSATLAPIHITALDELDRFTDGIVAQFQNSNLGADIHSVLDQIPGIVRCIRNKRAVKAAIALLVHDVVANTVDSSTFTLSIQQFHQIDLSRVDEDVFRRQFQKLSNHLHQSLKCARKNRALPSWLRGYVHDLVEQTKSKVLSKIDRELNLLRHRARICTHNDVPVSGNITVTIAHCAPLTVAEGATDENVQNLPSPNDSCSDIASTANPRVISDEVDAADHVTAESCVAGNTAPLQCSESAGGASHNADASEVETRDSAHVPSPSVSQSLESTPDPIHQHTVPVATASADDELRVGPDPCANVLCDVSLTSSCHPRAAVSLEGRDSVPTPSSLSPTATCDPCPDSCNSADLMVVIPPDDSAAVAVEQECRQAGENIPPLSESEPVPMNCTTLTPEEHTLADTLSHCLVQQAVSEVPDRGMFLFLFEEMSAKELRVKNLDPVHKQLARCLIPPIVDEVVECVSTAQNAVSAFIQIHYRFMRIFGNVVRDLDRDFDYDQLLVHAVVAATTHARYTLSFFFEVVPIVHLIERVHELLSGQLTSKKRLALAFELCNELLEKVAQEVERYKAEGIALIVELMPGHYRSLLAHLCANFKNCNMLGHQPHWFKMAQFDRVVPRATQLRDFFELTDGDRDFLQRVNDRSLTLVRSASGSIDTMAVVKSAWSQCSAMVDAKAEAVLSERFAACSERFLHHLNQTLHGVAQDTLNMLIAHLRTKTANHRWSLETVEACLYEVVSVIPRYVRNFVKMRAAFFLKIQTDLRPQFVKAFWRLFKKTVKPAGRRSSLMESLRAELDQMTQILIMKSLEERVFPPIALYHLLYMWAAHDLPFKLELGLTQQRP